MTQEASSEDFYNNVKLACALILQRKTQEGLAIIDQLQKQRPESAEVPYLMGLVAITMDEYGKALVLIEEAHERDPECYEYSEVLANLHVRVGNLNEGVYFAKLSTTLEPHPYVYDLIPADLSNFFVSLEQTAAPRHYIYGYVKLNKSEFTDAIQEFERQLSLDPDHALAHRDISAAYLAVGQYERAISHIQKAIALTPEDPMCHLRAGAISKRIGAFEPALYHFEKVLSAEEGNLELASAAYALAAALPQIDDETLAKLKGLLDGFAEDTPELPEEAAPASVRKDRIHVCYVLNNSWHYDTAALLEPILQAHDRSKFEIYLYQQNQGRSAFIQQLNNAADLERKLWEVDNEMATILIGGDDIDVLVNMCAPGSDNRATLFAMKPSTIQVGFHCGNFGASMPGITHVAADPSTEKAVAAHLTDDQKLLSVLPGLWAQKPSYLLPEVSASPAQTSGQVTFGALCDPETFTEAALALYVEALKQTPNSRLLFGAAGNCDGYPARRLNEMLGDTGLLERISVWPDKGVGEKWIPNPNYWREVDLFLIPGAFPNPLRAADALWMGVPVITLTGPRPLECMGTSILASANKLQWAKASAEEWLACVAELAADTEALNTQRMSLREELRATALFNPAAHVQALEALYTELVDNR